MSNLKGVPLWERLERQTIPEPNTGCWLFTMVLNSGYGQIFVNGRKWLAHRAAYELLVGPIPEGMTLDHLCRTRSCINPDHLEPVTIRENLRRGVNRVANLMAQTVCKWGHKFALEPNANGFRWCPECNRIRSRQYQRRKRLSYAS